MSIYKYRVTRPFTLFDRLFIDGDVIWIQSYDPVGGRWQKFFDSEKSYLGKISSDKYWELKGKYIEDYKDQLV